MPPVSSLPLIEVTSGFVLAISDWGKFLDTGEGGGVAQLFFLRDCQLPRVPSRKPTPGEEQALAYVAQFVDDYRKVTEGGVSPKMRKKLRDSLAEFFARNGSDFQNIETAASYINEAFDVTAVTFTIDFVPSTHRSYQEEKARVADLGYYRPPPPDPDMLYEAFIEKYGENGEQGGDPGGHYDQPGDPFSSGGKSGEPEPGENIGE